MENKVERRWGIVAVAVAMFFVTMVSTLINGQKSSIYYAVWFFVGVYGYKGNLESIRSSMKFLILLNLIVLVGVILFLHDDAYTYMYRDGTKESIILGVLVMCIPKVFLYFYCDKEIKENESKNKKDKEIEKIFNNQTAYGKNNNLAKALNQKIESMEDAYIKAAEVKSVPKNSVVDKNDNINFPMPKKIESMEDAYSQIAPQELNIRKNHDSKKVETMNNNEEKIWELVADEFDGDTRKKGLYAKLFAEMNGDEKKIQVMYYKIRVEELINEKIYSEELEAINDVKVNINYELTSDEECISKGWFEEEQIKGFNCFLLRNGKAVIDTEKKQIIYRNKSALKSALAEFRVTNKFSTSNMLNEIDKS
jgi:hypothetical protein